MLARIEDVEADIHALCERIEVEIAPFERQVELPCTIPGVARRAAEVIVAEIGVDMARFPTADHLASWAAVCPGQRESAGKRKSAKTRAGPTWLRTVLIECANSVAKSKGTYLSERYRQVARRRGHKKTIVAVAHKILTTAWHLLTNDEPYVDPGPEFLRSMSADKIRQRSIRQLQGLGYVVKLEPLAQSA